MKIICTKEERAYILSHATEGLCPALMHHNLCGRGDCISCLIQEIDWEITDDEEIDMNTEYTIVVHSTDDTL